MIKKLPFDGSVTVHADAIVHRTARAVLFRLALREFWVPLAYLDGVNLSRRGPFVFSLPCWLAEKVGLLIPFARWQEICRGLDYPDPTDWRFYYDVADTMLFHVNYLYTDIQFLQETVARLEAENRQLRKKVGRDK